MKIDKASQYLLALFVILALLGVKWYAWDKEEDLMVNVLDVGQGDAIHIRMPTHEDVLIDGGPDATVLEKLGETMPWYDRTIELMILTHPHSDHIDGLLDVMERFKVERVITTDVQYHAPDYIYWNEIIGNYHKETATAGSVYEFGEVKLSVLYPFEDLTGTEIKNVNNASIVTKLSYREVTFLFTGDVEQEVESQLISNVDCEESDGFCLKSDVLKVGHHGSNTSSSHEFVGKVSPNYAIISVGKDNKFGHPTSETLQTFNDQKVEVYRTDTIGEIVIKTDGENIEFL